MDDVIAALDLGRLKVVEAFAFLTSKPMHEIWGRNDA
jgi:hypothetical protein